MTTGNPMQLGMVGLGRMGAGLVGRLMRDGHTCVVYDVNPDAVSALEKEGATGSTSMGDFVEKLAQPRAVWVMVPAGDITAKTISDLASHMDSGDIIIDGGNSTTATISARQCTGREGIHHIDCGTSGGVWGMERGYCLMIGGEAASSPVSGRFSRTHRPGCGHAPRTPGRDGDPDNAEHGYCTAAPTVPVTSSRWSTTALSTA